MVAVYRHHRCRLVVWQGHSANQINHLIDCTSTPEDLLVLLFLPFTPGICILSSPASAGPCWFLLSFLMVHVDRNYHGLSILSSGPRGSSSTPRLFHMACCPIDWTPWTRMISRGFWSIPTPTDYQIVQLTLRVACCPLNWTPTDFWLFFVICGPCILCFRC
jgi:hypothetical protein